MSFNLPVDRARELLYAGPSARDGSPGADLVWHDDVQGDQSRWMMHHMLIVRKEDTGELFAADYEVGLTEYQDVQPWDGYSEVEFYPVTVFPVTTCEYRRTND